MKSVDLRRQHRQATFGAAAGLLFVVLAAVAIAASGCSGGGDANASSGANTAGEKSGENGQSKSSAETTDTAETRTAEQVLKDMEATYRNVARYGDKAQLHRYFTRSGDTLEQMFLYSVAFERPNKLRLDCYDARVVCDGQHFFATVPHVPNVVLKAPAPASLTPNDVVRDQQLHRALFETPVGPPFTLALLMQDNPLAELLREAMAPPKLLSQESFDGHRCNRLEVDTSFGKLLFWIDAKSNTLLRLDLPPVFAKPWEQAGEKTTGLTVSFANAQFDPKFSDETFKFEVPADAKVADSLVPVFKPAPIAARSEPTNLKLTKLWSAGDVKNPGNLLVFEAPNGDPRILVIDGSRSVVELDGDGKIVARHDLDLPPQVLVSYLRTAVDQQGKRYFVAGANGQPLLHVFDENWKRTLSFPKPEDAPGTHLSNVLITDLAGDGTPELCVGYWGDVGLQGVALDGNQIWREPTLLDVQPTAVTEPNADGKRQLLCTHQRGTVVRYDETGKAVGEVVVPNRFVGIMIGADVEGAGKNNYCALGITAEQKNVAMGIALEGSELWNYELPDGAPGRPVEMVGVADLAGDGAKEWLIAGSDSSIHILSAAGTPVDKFNNGAMLCGLAGTKLGEKHVLLISSVLDKAEGGAHSVLEAWQVEK